MSTGVFKGVPSWGVTEQAEHLATEMHVSSNSSRNIEVGVEVKPSYYVGRRLIDVASGFSDFVACVNQAGGHAIGVDVGYDDLPSLIAKGKVYVDEQSRDIGRSKRGEIALAEAMGTLPKAEIERLQSVVDDLEGATMDRCLKDMEENPQNYLGASVLSLPFEDGYFQDGFSFSFFTSLGTHYDDFASEAMIEVLRVIERGGTFKIGPNWFKFSDDTEVKRCRTVEEGVMRAFDDAKKAGVAEKIARHASRSGMLRYDIKRSRKR